MQETMKKFQRHLDNHAEKQSSMDAEHIATMLCDYVAAYHDGQLKEDDYLVINLCDDNLHFRVIVSLPEQEDGLAKLSPREQQIAVLVAEGHPTKRIAYQLKISPNTVKTYIQRIFTKLTVTSRSEMIAQMMKIGLLH